jgi:hypothetical protein
MTARAFGNRVPTTGSRRHAVVVAALVTVLLIGAGLFAAVDLVFGLHRLPDSAEIVSTSWSSTQWVKKGGKANVTLRLRRRDQRPISSKFIVFAYGGQVTPSGPSGQSFIVLPSVQAQSVQPAAEWNAREVTIVLEMIPSRPSEGDCAGDVIVYNDAPIWQQDWLKALPDFVKKQLPDMSVRSWHVSLPAYPEEATVSRGE